MADPPVPAPAAPLGFLINELRTALRAAYEEALAPLRLTVPQVGALSALARSPGASVAQLAHGKAVRPQSMATHVASLEALGLVERRHAAGSGHAWQLRLTAAGREALGRGAAAMGAVEERLWDRIVPEDRARFRELLERHAAVLRAQPGPGGRPGPGTGVAAGRNARTAPSRAGGDR